MSDQTPDTTATETTDQAPETAPEVDTGEQAGGNQEAKKYRLKLRDTEAERDTLRERVTTYERAEVERLAVDLADPADLWVSGVELDTLRGEDGAIDHEKVKTAVGELLEQRPHWKKKLPSLAPPASLVSGATGRAPTPPAASWSDILSSSHESL